MQPVSRASATAKTLLSLAQREPYCTPTPIKCKTCIDATHRDSGVSCGDGWNARLECPDDLVEYTEVAGTAGESGDQPAFSAIRAITGFQTRGSRAITMLPRIVSRRIVTPKALSVLATSCTASVAGRVAAQPG